MSYPSLSRVPEVSPPGEAPVLITPYGQLVLLLLIAVVVVVVLRLMARRRMTMGFGLFWLTGFIGVAALLSYRPLLLLIASLLGTLYPDAAVRLLAFVALLGVQIYLSVRLSLQEQRLSDLAQAVALLEHELRQERTASAEMPKEK